MPRAEMTPRKSLERALDKLPPLLCFAIRQNALARIARADAGGPVAGLEAAGLVRQLHSDLEVAIGTADPSWPLVKALHRAWIAAGVWERSARAETSRARPVAGGGQ